MYKELASSWAVEPLRSLCRKCPAPEAVLEAWGEADISAGVAATKPADRGRDGLSSALSCQN